MTYEEFVKAFDAISRTRKTNRNSVIFIDKPVRTIIAALSSGSENILGRFDVKVEDFSLLTPTKLNELVFEETRDPKVIILAGNKAGNPMASDDTRYASLRMIYMALPEPAAVVVLTEHERGWGAKPFDATPYYTVADAERRVKEVNSHNNLPSAPDYYITADMTTDPSEFARYERFY